MYNTVIPPNNTCTFYLMVSFSVIKTIIIVFSVFSVPHGLYISAIDIGLRKLSFTWSPVAPDCPAIHYNILASNCGSCPTTTNHSTVTCTDIPVNSHVCTFAVKRVLCGNLTDNMSRSLTINITDSETAQETGTPKPIPDGNNL